MRLRFNLGTLTVAALAAAGGIVALHATQDNSLSQGLSDTLVGFGLGGIVPIPSPSGAADGFQPSPSAGSNAPSGLPPGPYGSIAAMIQQNGNFLAQMQAYQNGQWKNIFGAAGRTDWQSFRTLQIRQGLPDPGENAPVDWYRS